MHISLIVAVADDWAMGLDNNIPWHLSDDLKRFKSITWGKPVIMGRKTFDSLKKPLTNRLNIVLSRNPITAQHSNVIYCSSFDTAVQIAKKHIDSTLGSENRSEIIIAGGSAIYRLALPIATKIYLTRLYKKVKADTYFPKIDLQYWQVMSSEIHTTQDAEAIKYEYINLIKGT